jgi:hypothetical protein
MYLSFTQMNLAKSIYIKEAIEVDEIVLSMQNHTC